MAFCSSLREPAQIYAAIVENASNCHNHPGLSITRAELSYFTNCTLQLSWFSLVPSHAHAKYITHLQPWPKMLAILFVAAITLLLLYLIVYLQLSWLSSLGSLSGTHAHRLV